MTDMKLPILTVGLLTNLAFCFAYADEKATFGIYSSDGMIPYMEIFFSEDGSSIEKNFSSSGKIQRKIYCRNGVLQELIASQSEKDEQVRNKKTEAKGKTPSNLCVGF